jgi:hypothetical protein
MTSKPQVPGAKANPSVATRRRPASLTRSAGRVASSSASEAPGHTSTTVTNISVTQDFPQMWRDTLRFAGWMATLFVCSQHDQLLATFVAGAGLMSTGGKAGEILRGLTKL